MLTGGSGGTPPTGGGGGNPPPTGGSGGTPPTGGGGGNPPPAGGSGGTPPTGGGGGNPPPAGGDFSEEYKPTPGLRDSTFEHSSKWDLAMRGDPTQTRLQNLGRRISNAAGAAGYRNYRKLVDTAKTLPKKGGRFIRRTAVGAAGAIPLAVLGAGVGIASGDPSKALQLATAGGTAGYYGANYYGDKVARGLEGTASTARNAFWGSDVKKLDRAKYDKDWQKKPENIDELTKALGSRKDANEAIRDGSVQALLNNGITDPKKVGKALKLRNKLMKEDKKDKNGNVIRKKIENPDEALEYSIATAKWNRDAGKAIYEVNSRARREFMNQTIEQIIVNSGNTISREEASKKVELILDDMEDFES